MRSFCARGHLPFPALMSDNMHREDGQPGEAPWNFSAQRPPGVSLPRHDGQCSSGGCRPISLLSLEISPSPLISWLNFLVCPACINHQAPTVSSRCSTSEMPQI